MRDTHDTHIIGSGRVGTIRQLAEGARPGPGSSSFYSQSRFSSPYSVNKPGLEGVIFNNFPHTKALMHSLVKRVRH
jgi:hypothetical protein